MGGSGYVLDSDQGVVARAAGRGAAGEVGIHATCRRTEIGGVASAPTEKDVITRPAVKDIVAGSPVQGVVLFVTGNLIVPRPSGDVLDVDEHVVPCGAGGCARVEIDGHVATDAGVGGCIRTITAVELIVTDAAVERVVA